MHKNHNSGLNILWVISLFHTISFSLFNSKTVRVISMKLGTLIKHDEIMCHAKEP